MSKKNKGQIVRKIAKKKYLQAKAKGKKKRKQARDEEAPVGGGDLANELGLAESDEDEEDEEEAEEREVVPDIPPAEEMAKQMSLGSMKKLLATMHRKAGTATPDVTGLGMGVELPSHLHKNNKKLVKKPPLRPKHGKGGGRKQKPK